MEHHVPTVRISSVLVGELPSLCKGRTCLGVGNLLKGTVFGGVLG